MAKPCSSGGILMPPGPAGRAGCSCLDRRYTARDPFPTTGFSREDHHAASRSKKVSAPVLPLKDPSLFRQQCYINGKWVDADSGKTIDVNNPATGEILGTVPNLGAAETRRAIEAANARLAGLAQEDRQGARQYPAQMVRPDDGEPGRPRHADDRRAGQAAGRGQGRDRLRRLLRRMVRRGSQARLRRHHSRSISPTSASS